MKKISLSDRAGDIVAFLKSKGIDVSETLSNSLLSFFTQICSYEEEERKIFPHLIIGCNIESDRFRRLFQVEEVPISFIEDEKLFFKFLKPLLPFCNNGWRVYVDMKDNGLSLGLVRIFSGIGGLTVDEVLKDPKKDNIEAIRSEYEICYVLIEPRNVNEFQITAMDGENVVVDFCLYKEDEEALETEKKDFLEDILTDTRNEKITRAIKNVIELFPQKLHGAICLVVDQNCELPNEQLRDGIFLKAPIDLVSLVRDMFDKNISHTMEYRLMLNEKFYALSGLWLEMLNFDGITIIDNSGKIRAYNVFITPEQGTSVSFGGARKRAALALLNNPMDGYIGVYFQSQDGNSFYKRCKR